MLKQLVWLFFQHDILKKKKTLTKILSFNLMTQLDEKVNMRTLPYISTVAQCCQSLVVCSFKFFNASSCFVDNLSVPSVFFWTKCVMNLTITHRHTAASQGAPCPQDTYTKRVLSQAEDSARSLRLYLWQGQTDTQLCQTFLCVLSSQKPILC